MVTLLCPLYFYLKIKEKYPPALSFKKNKNSLPPPHPPQIMNVENGLKKIIFRKRSWIT